MLPTSASRPRARKRQTSSSTNSLQSIPELTVSIEGDLQWIEYEVPESNAPVLLARLRTDPESRGFTSVVRFPKGWERLASGSYASGEEFIVLEGSLEINERTFHPDDWVYAPAGAVRKNSRSTSGALTLAFFSGPARWALSSAEADKNQEQILTRRLEAAGESIVSPLGARGWLLFPGQGSSSWLIDPLEGGTAPIDAEVFEIETKTWTWVPKGSVIPNSGRCFCRTFDEQVRRIG